MLYEKKKCENKFRNKNKFIIKMKEDKIKKELEKFGYKLCENCNCHKKIDSTKWIFKCETCFRKIEIKETKIERDEVEEEDNKEEEINEEEFNKIEEEEKVEEIIPKKKRSSRKKKIEEIKEVIPKKKRAPRKKKEIQVNSASAEKAK